MSVKKTTAAAAAKASMPDTEFKLPSGAIATKIPFKGKHVRSAGRLAAGQDETTAVWALITVKFHIDGKPIMIEDLDEMDGDDVVELMGRAQGLF